MSRPWELWGITPEAWARRINEDAIETVRVARANGRREAIEECAKVADRLAEMMEAGAGDYPRGRRLRQCGELIRALSTPSPTKSVENSRSVVVEPKESRCLCDFALPFGQFDLRCRNPKHVAAAQHKPEGEP